MKINRRLFILMAALLLAGGVFHGASAADRENACCAQVRSNVLANGIYLILQEVEKPEQLKPMSKLTHVVRYDYRFFDPSERGKPSFVAVSPEQFVPIVINKAPTKEPDANGRPKLLLELAESQVKPLEEFTLKNVNKSIAIVIGEQVVTTHKIREPIVGGKMQITRCSDHGCDVLYTQLQGSSKKEASP